MFDKTWTDQPDVVTEAEIVHKYYADGRSYEIRRKLLAGTPMFFVTAGNLFGSQTVVCETDLVLWAVLREASKKRPKLPSGARILE